MNRMGQMEEKQRRAATGGLCLRPMSTTSRVPSAPPSSPQSVGGGDPLSRSSGTNQLLCLFPAHSQLRYQSDADLDILRRRLSNAPRPLKKRSSITEPEGPQGPNIQKLLYQRLVALAAMCNAIKSTTALIFAVDRFNTLAGSMDGCCGKSQRHVNSPPGGRGMPTS